MSHLDVSVFNKLAKVSSNFAGKPACFGIAFASILVWAISGPFFHFSDTWQLVINTSTTIITFLMVFLIQNTQNRDMISMQVKLDELIKANKKTNNALLVAEEMNDEEMQELLLSYKQLASECKTSGDDNER